MAVNSALARIFGNDLDAISLAPLGTTLPTDISAALSAEYVDVGWLNSDDGFTETATGSVEKFRGHQGNGVIRTRMSEPGTTIAFTAMETKAQTLGLRYNEKNVETVDGVRRVTRGPGQIVAAKVAVIDVFDADDATVKERFVIPRFEISPNGDRQLTNSAIAALPFTGEIIGDYFHYMTDLEAA